jgi:hypothetical protein
MNLKQISYLSITLLASTNVAIAATPANLAEKREQVITRYIADLGKADYKDIATLFEKKATVISTSKGEANAQAFFTAFLPTIASANTQLSQYFINKKDINRFAARFHLSFILKTGEKDNGNYIDEFIFAPHSDKLSAIYMFENLKAINKFA